MLPIGFPPSIRRTLRARNMINHNVLSDMHHLMTCQVLLPNGALKTAKALGLTIPERCWPPQTR